MTRIICLPNPRWIVGNMPNLTSMLLGTRKFGVCWGWIGISPGPLVIWKPPAYHLSPGFFIPVSVVKGKSSMTTGKAKPVFVIKRPPLPSQTSVYWWSWWWWGGQYDKELAALNSWTGGLTQTWIFLNLGYQVDLLVNSGKRGSHPTLDIILLLLHSG